jgi:ppGpp synthetase/RelA/SpoT-type nucleotidyltranferase
MTQKELSYFEDAIGHVKNIISIITESIKQLEDQKLISFLENELSEQTQLKEKLINKLEEKNA